MDRVIKRQYQILIQSSQSVPRVVSIVDDRVYLNPIPELSALRGKLYTDDNLKVVNGTFNIDFYGDQLEIYAVVSSSDAFQFGVNVRVSPDRDEFTTIFISSPPSKKI